MISPWSNGQGEELLFRGISYLNNGWGWNTSSTGISSWVRIKEKEISPERSVLAAVVKVRSSFSEGLAPWVVVEVGRFHPEGSAQGAGYRLGRSAEQELDASRGSTLRQQRFKGREKEREREDAREDEPPGSQEK